MFTWRGYCESDGDSTFFPMSDVFKEGMCAEDCVMHDGDIIPVQWNCECRVGYYNAIRLTLKCDVKDVERIEALLKPNYRIDKRDPSYFDRKPTTFTTPSKEITY